MSHIRDYTGDLLNRLLRGTSGVETHMGPSGFPPKQ